MRTVFIAVLILALAPAVARAATASPTLPPTDATAAVLASPDPVESKAPAPKAFMIPPPSVPPHIARPYRGPKPKQEGLQVQAKPPLWPVRAAQFLGWAFVP